jgi:chloramphenicol 3-O-phosphotransferase
MAHEAERPVAEDPLIIGRVSEFSGEPMVAGKTGQIVVVAGTTGSGKTTTCRTFLSRAEEVWLHFGVDLYLGTMLSRKFVDGGARSNECLHMAPLDPAKPAGPAEMRLGELGLPLIDTMHRMAAAAAKNGHNVVMDHVPTLSPPLLRSCVRALQELPLLFVALKPPRDVLMKRIDDRLPEVVAVLGPEQGRITNEGCKQASDFIYREIFTHHHFDLILDTAVMSPEQVADRIIARLREGPGTAFAALARELGV